MIKKALACLLPIVALMAVAASAAERPAGLDPICLAVKAQAPQTAVENPALNLPTQVPAPQLKDLTCLQECRAEYNHCKSTCLPGACWVCFPYYENCLDTCN